MMNSMRNATNPQAMFNQMVSQNPKMQEIMQYINENGGDAKQAYYKMAEQKGIDPNYIINELSK